MDYRYLGKSGLRVPALSLGAATFGGGTPFFKAWGETGVDGARRMIDMCLDAGVNLIDTADVYSKGLSEEIYPYWHQAGFAERNPFPVDLK